MNTQNPEVEFLKNYIPLEDDKRQPIKGSFLYKKGDKSSKFPNYLAQRMVTEKVAKYVQ